MNELRGAIEKTIPISLFNKGMAGKIFSDVRSCGAKVVMKNNAPECVLLSPDEYIHIMDELNDARLLSVASERMSKFDPSTLITQAEIDKEFGFKPENLAEVGKIEFE